jgi:hypothetical protein
MKKGYNGSMPFQPYKTFDLTNHLSIEVYGKPNNWSMYRDESWQNLEMFAKQRNLPRILSPFPEVFNARICIQKDLIEYKPNIFRTPFGEPAEGIVIPNGTSFWTTSADCPMIVIYNPEGTEVAASHSGRDSLIDSDFLMGKPARENFSVVDGLVKTFPQALRPKLKVFFVSRIGAEHFAHPFDHDPTGPRNKRIIETIVERFGRDCIVGELEQGHISLPMLIRRQCEAYGISQENIMDGGLDTYTDTNLWSHRRGNTKERNGILVIHS